MGSSTLPNQDISIHPVFLNSQIHRSELHTDLTHMKAGKRAQETIKISTKEFLSTQ
jgi:hypothetical protein